MLKLLRERFFSWRTNANRTTWVRSCDAFALLGCVPLLQLATIHALLRVRAGTAETCRSNRLDAMCLRRVSPLFEGSHGASKYVTIAAFPTAEQAVEFLKTECSCKFIVGLLGCLPDGYSIQGYPVVADSDLAQVPLLADSSFAVGNTSSNAFSAHQRSFPVSSRPFKEGNACFAVGKERHGLSLELARHCDTFVHVPHVNIAGESNNVPPALLDLPSCISITLHHFTNWAGYDERTFHGYKFEVELPRGRLDGKLSTEIRQRRAEEKLQKYVEAEAIKNRALGLFHIDEDDESSY